MKIQSPTQNRNDEPGILGRESECSELNAFLEKAKSGQATMVLLAGEAGVGKTALAENFLHAADLPVFIGRALQDATPPYGPITAVLRMCMQQRPDIDQACGPLKPYLGLLLPELGAPPEHPDRATLTEAIGAAFDAMVSEGAVAIFFDDLQWADEATLELLPALNDRMSGKPFFLLAAYRSDEIARGHRLRWLRNELRRRRQLHEILLKPLSRQVCREVITQVLQKPVSDALARLIYEQTQGLPLFIEELAASLAGSNRLELTEEGVALLPGEAMPIPESVRDAILLRLDGVSDEARQQLEVAAVAGIEFDLNLVAELAGTEAGLDELFERSLIFEKEPGVGAFRHALTREAVRSNILWTRRRALNREIARFFEESGEQPEFIAEHWLEANEVGPARKALLAAADKSCRLHAYRDAAIAAAKALEIWPEGEEEEVRLQALRRMASCAQMSGQLPDAVRAWREVLASELLSGEHRQLGEAERALATLYGLQGAWEQALSCRKAAAGAFEKAGEPAEAALEYMVTAGRLGAMLHTVEAIDMCGRAVELASKAERIDIQTRAMALQGNIMAMKGDGAEGLELVRQALSISLENNLTEAASEVYRRLASALEYSADYSGARDAYETAYDFCLTHGADAQAQLCLGCMSWVLYQTCDWKRAVEVCKESIASETTPDGSRAISLGMLGLIRAHRGEYRMARKHLSEALALSRRERVLPMENACLYGLGLLYEYEGEVKTAAAYYRELIEHWEKTQDRHDAMYGLSAAASFFVAHGEEKEVARCVNALSQMAAATGNTENLALLSAALGESSLLAGDPAEAVKQLRQAKALLQKLDVPLEDAIVGLHLGEALVRANVTEQGIRHLRNGYRFARKLGCRPLAGRFADLLQGLGETVEDRRGDGDTAHGLTARQLEITRLLAAGLTNKEIAGRLYLSPRTIDMHVGRILDRLDCRSRTEAVSRAAEMGLLDTDSSE